MSDKCVACGEVADGKPLYKKLGSSDCQVEVFTALLEMELLSLPEDEKNNHYICWDCDETIAEEYATFISTEEKKKAVEAKRKQQDEACKTKLQKKLKQAFKKARNDALKASDTTPVSKYKLKEKEREENRYYASFCLLCKCPFEASKSRGYQRFTLQKMVDDESDVSDVLMKMGVKLNITAELKRKRFICCQCYNKIRRNYKALNKGTEVGSPLPLHLQESNDPMSVFQRRPTAEEHAAEIAKLIPPSLANLYKVITNEDGVKPSKAKQNLKSRNRSKSKEGNLNGTKKKKQKILSYPHNSSKNINPSSFPSSSSSTSSSLSSSSDLENEMEKSVKNGYANSNKKGTRKISETSNNKNNKRIKTKKGKPEGKRKESPKKTPTIRTLLPKHTNEVDDIGNTSSTALVASEDTAVVDFGICNLCGLGYNSRPKEFWYKLSYCMPSVMGVTVMNALQILDSELADVSSSVREKELVCKPCFSRVCKGFRSQILRTIAEKNRIDVSKLELSKVKVKKNDSFYNDNTDCNQFDHDQRKLNGAIINNNNNDKYNNESIIRENHSNEKVNTPRTKPMPKCKRILASNKERVNNSSVNNLNGNHKPILNNDPKQVNKSATEKSPKRISPESSNKDGSSFHSTEKFYKFKRCVKSFKKILSALQSDLELINLINDSRHLRYKGKVVLLSSVTVNIANLSGILTKSELIKNVSIRLELHKDMYQFSNFRRNLKNKKDWTVCVICQKEHLPVEMTTRWLEDPVAPPNLMVPLRWAYLSIVSAPPNSKINYATDDGKVCQNCHCSLKKDFGTFVGSRVASSHGLSSEKVVLEKYKVSFDSIAMNIVADPLETSSVCKDKKNKQENQNFESPKPASKKFKSSSAHTKENSISNCMEANKSDKNSPSNTEVNTKTVSKSDSKTLNSSNFPIDASNSDGENNSLRSNSKGEESLKNSSHDVKLPKISTSVSSEASSNLNTESKEIPPILNIEGKEAPSKSNIEEKQPPSNINIEDKTLEASSKYVSDSCVSEVGEKDTLSMDLHLSDSEIEEEQDKLGNDSENKSDENAKNPPLDTCKSRTTKCQNLSNEKENIKDKDDRDAELNRSSNDPEKVSQIISIENEQNSVQDSIKESEVKEKSKNFNEEKSSKSYTSDKEILGSHNEESLSHNKDDSEVEVNSKNVEENSSKSSISANEVSDSLNVEHLSQNSDDELNEDKNSNSLVLNLSTSSKEDDGEQQQQEDSEKESQTIAPEKDNPVESRNDKQNALEENEQTTNFRRNIQNDPAEMKHLDNTKDDDKSSDSVNTNTKEIEDLNRDVDVPRNETEISHPKNTVSNLGTVDDQDDICSINKSSDKESSLSKKRKISETSIIDESVNKKKCLEDKQILEVTKTTEPSQPLENSKNLSNCEINLLPSNDDEVSKVPEILVDNLQLRQKEPEISNVESDSEKHSNKVSQECSTRANQKQNENELEQELQLVENHEDTSIENFSKELDKVSSKKSQPPTAAAVETNKMNSKISEPLIETTAKITNESSEISQSQPPTQVTPETTNQISSEISQPQPPTQATPETNNQISSEISQPHATTTKETIKINSKISPETTSSEATSKISSELSEHSTTSVTVATATGSKSIPESMSPSTSSNTMALASTSSSRKRKSIYDGLESEPELSLSSLSSNFMETANEEEETELGEDTVAPFAQRKKFKNRNQINDTPQISEKEALQYSMDDIWNTIQSINLDDLISEGIENPLKSSQYTLGLLFSLNDLRIHLGASVEDLVLWIDKLMPIEMKNKGLKPSIEKFSLYLSSLEKVKDITSSLLKQVLPREWFYVSKVVTANSSQEKKNTGKCYIEDIMDPSRNVQNPKWEDFLKPVNLDNLIIGKPSRVSWNDFNNGLLYALWKVNKMMNYDNDNYIKWLSLTSTAVLKYKDYIAMSKAVLAIDKHLQNYPEDINRLIAPVVVRSSQSEKTSNTSSSSSNISNPGPKSDNNKSESFSGDDVIVEKQITKPKNSLTVGS